MPVEFLWVKCPAEVPEHQQGEPPPVPQEVLDRHGSRVLKPAEALPDPRKDSPPLRSTVYRAATLLVPNRVLRDPATRAEVERVCGETDVDAEWPPDLGESNQELRPYLEFLGDLPRPVVLRPRAGKPAVNAWVVLQAMRSAVLAGRFTKERAAVERMSVEHVLFAAAFEGTPTSEPHGVRDVLTPGAVSEYGRRPVAFFADPPARPDPVRGGRRPVVVVLDTGYGSHPWFGTTPEVTKLPPGGFLHAFEVGQQAIAEQQRRVAGLTRTQVLEGSWETPVFSDGLTQVVSPATGHGTFIAGIIRQRAPGADVLTMRVLHPDNVAYEGDLLLALWLLLARLRRARKTGDQSEVFDVLSLSLGFYPESRSSDPSARLTEVLRELAAEGVQIVAAAGNDSTARPFMPAELRAENADTGWTGPELIGVGALNPNGTTAWFSNGGVSVGCLASGASVISTFPDDVRGSGNPAGTVAAGRREGMDLDDFSSGFAMWSGTSFAAPLVAARVANAMIACAKAQPELGFDRNSGATMVRRAKLAVRALKS
jgi:hypothetical protein